MGDAEEERSEQEAFHMVAQPLLNQVCYHLKVARRGLPAVGRHAACGQASSVFKNEACASTAVSSAVLDYAFEGGACAEGATPYAGSVLLGIVEGNC